MHFAFVAVIFAFALILLAYAPKGQIFVCAFQTDKIKSVKLWGKGGITGKISLEAIPGQTEKGSYFFFVKDFSLHFT